MNQTAIKRLTNLAKEDLPDDCSIEQVFEWMTNFLVCAGSQDVLFQLETSLMELN